MGKFRIMVFMVSSAMSRKIERLREQISNMSRESIEKEIRKSLITGFDLDRMKVLQAQLRMYKQGLVKNI